jgi:EAL domain-containing protein (putative c-di-GMP-specific phosphodiesterase class I)
MTARPADVAIVEAIVALARNLGMKSIAEWVEDSATLETLASLGVDYVQGYAISYPMPPEALLQACCSVDFITDKTIQGFVRKELAGYA